MKLIRAFLTFIMIFFSFPFEVRASVPAEAQGSQLLRVRLLSLSQKVQFTGVSLRFQNIRKNYQSVAISKSSRAEVRLMKKGDKNFWALRLDDKDPEHLITEKFLMVQGEGLRAGAQTLPPRVLLSVSAKDQIDVVGVLPLDEYVTGVLASEMPLSWPLETLKAQAVAARSYALAVMKERQNRSYHLESSILDQVFRHVGTADMQSPLYQKALRAVRETAGVTLRGAHQEILKAFYHADCGGQTTTPAHVWRSGVNSGVVLDRSCPSNPRAHWSFSMGKAELQRRLGLVDLLELQVVKNDSDGRVQSVRVTSAAGVNRVISANDFRQALGFQELRSALFEVKRREDIFEFQGRGFGHGVGLCQWGSRVLGQRGQNFRQILKHYYPLAKLQ